jgi:hypothetical protein
VLAMISLLFHKGNVKLGYFFVKRSSLGVIWKTEFKLRKTKTKVISV